MRLLGTDVPTGLARVIRGIGSIVEAPALFPRFSGRRNLEILARIDGIASGTVGTPSTVSGCPRGRATWCGPTRSA